MALVNSTAICFGAAATTFAAASCGSTDHRSFALQNHFSCGNSYGSEGYKLAETYRYRQSELQHARWAMLGVAGILAQEILKPGVFW